ncbi:flagellar protein FlaG [Duganella radicis]|uniref:Flagellar protein n=1 Tax=Duganella radicis TaxID=551988 RepID=A0A6L6PCT4_9BURK|nr:flagellar protein FlaG [Duganella radicis]MTV36185.1 flagellar protein [Duganella radicis]
MDTSSINRLDLLPAATAPVSVPASGKTVDAGTAQAIVAGKDATAARVPSKTELRNSVDAINRFLENTSEVHFSIDEDSGISVVKVIDTETKKVLQQFPSEQSLEIGKNLSTKGLLINSEA